MLCSLKRTEIGASLTRQLAVLQPKFSSKCLRLYYCSSHTEKKKITFVSHSANLIYLTNLYTLLESVCSLPLKTFPLPPVIQTYLKSSLYTSSLEARPSFLYPKYLPFILTFSLPELTIYPLSMFT